MGCMKNFTILLSVVVIGLSIYLYSPIPDGVEEPWKVRSILAAGKLIKLLCVGSSLIGYSSCLNITRSSINFMLPSPPLSSLDPQLKVTDTTFDGIKVRIYRPKTAETPSPALMYFHGGGWSTGSIDASDTFAMELAKLSNIVVVSVEYRLAPEFPFPIPFEDCVTATLHLLHHYKEYGVDGNMVAVGGDSAGGNIAAATSLLFGSNPNVPNITLQVLINSPLQVFNFQLPSYINPDNHLTLSPATMTDLWSNYLGPTSHPDLPSQMVENLHISPAMKKSHFQMLVNASLYKTDFGKEKYADLDSGNETLWKEIEVRASNPYLSPLTAHEVYNLPATIIVTSTYDPLHDEGVMFKERLENKEVKVIHKNYDLPHGMVVLVDHFEASRKAVKEIAMEMKILFEELSLTE